MWQGLLTIGLLKVVYAAYPPCTTPGTCHWALPTKGGCLWAFVWPQRIRRTVTSGKVWLPVLKQIVVVWLQIGAFSHKASADTDSLLVIHCVGWGFLRPSPRPSATCVHQEGAPATHDQQQYQVTRIEFSQVPLRSRTVAASQFSQVPLAYSRLDLSPEGRGQWQHQ